MQNSRLLRAAVLVVAVTILLSFGALARAGQEKVDVCHITGTATVDGVPDTPVGHVIHVAEPAYQAHIDHGDPEQWHMVVLDNGKEVCTPGLPVQCPCYTAQGLQDYYEAVFDEFDGWDTYAMDRRECHRNKLVVLDALERSLPYPVWPYSFATGWSLTTGYMCHARIEYPQPQGVFYMNLTLPEREACVATLLQSAIWQNSDVNWVCP